MDVVCKKLFRSLDKLEDKIRNLDNDELKEEFILIKNKISNIKYSDLEHWHEFIWSNCLIQTIMHWIKAPTQIKILKYGTWIKCLKRGTFPHFYWYDSRDCYFYDFRGEIGNTKYWINSLWYKGQLHRWKGLGYHI